MLFVPKLGPAYCLPSILRFSVFGVLAPGPEVDLMAA